jgi:hypothetical protein
LPVMTPSCKRMGFDTSAAAAPARYTPAIQPRENEWNWNLAYLMCSHCSPAVL